MHRSHMIGFLSKGGSKGVWIRLPLWSRRISSVFGPKVHSICLMQYIGDLVGNKPLSYVRPISGTHEVENCRGPQGSLAVNYRP